VRDDQLERNVTFINQILSTAAVKLVSKSDVKIINLCNLLYMHQNIYTSDVSNSYTCFGMP
jgi:hypothetical protein